MAGAALSIPVERVMSRARRPVSDKAGRFFAAGATVLGGSVLSDSAMEHYRGSFSNPAMVLPLAASAVTLAVNARRAAGGGPGSGASASSHVAAVVTGLAGLGFHLFNVGKQPGGYILNNFFYKAPIGAPGALILSGMLGAGADRLGRGRARGSFLQSPKVLGAITALGLAGTVAEVGLLHFRGAFHNPAMWLPLAVPPVTALSLARDVVRAVPSSATVVLLTATAALGLAGSAFHAYGISRNMGGWRNWRQNLLAGPPLPAPPSFTGLAIAGLGVLILLGRMRRG